MADKIFAGGGYTFVVVTALGVESPLIALNNCAGSSLYVDTFPQRALCIEVLSHFLAPLLLGYSFTMNAAGKCCAIMIYSGNVIPRNSNGVPPIHKLLLRLNCGCLSFFRADRHSEQIVTVLLFTPVGCSRSPSTKMLCAGCDLIGLKCLVFGTSLMCISLFDLTFILRVHTAHVRVFNLSLLVALMKALIQPFMVSWSGVSMNLPWVSCCSIPSAGFSSLCWCVCCGTGLYWVPSDSLFCSSSMTAARIPLVCCIIAPFIVALFTLSTLDNKKWFRTIVRIIGTVRCFVTCWMLFRFIVFSFCNSKKSGVVAMMSLDSTTSGLHNYTYWCKWVPGHHYLYLTSLKQIC